MTKKEKVLSILNNHLEYDDFESYMFYVKSIIENSKNRHITLSDTESAGQSSFLQFMKKIKSKNAISAIEPAFTSGGAPLFLPMIYYLLIFENPVQANTPTEIKARI